MPQGVNDPRQVLTILNSLGFVGITAEQLKSFMKDLKLHQKMKERQQEQWREETKKKVFSKQRQAFAKIINPNSKDPSIADVTDNESSTVKIRIKCVTESDTNDEIDNVQTRAQVYDRKQSPSTTKRRDKKKDLNLCDRHEKEIVIKNENELEQNKKRTPICMKTVKTIPERIASTPEVSDNTSRSRSRSKSVTSDSTRRRNPSRSSSRSQTKSFIRPWKLYPEVQRSSQNVKLDPVLLYQQYQKEWKQRLLPGENRHAGIRWAVREKMLGTDPTPRPILKKSCSSISIKRR